MSERLTRVGSEIDPSYLAHPTLAAMRGYWESKRAGRAMPSRADVSPTHFREHLGWVSLVEALEGLNDFRYRLLGTLINEYFMDDATGRTVRETFSDRPAIANAIVGICRKCARDGIVMRSFGDAGWMGDGYENFDSIYLPLSDDGSTVNFVMSVFVFDRPKVLMARQIAKANGGQLVRQPASHH